MSESTLTQRVLKNLEKRRENVLQGNVNCIPSPFTRFRGDFPGIEQGQYILISGATKASKTQLTNYLVIINTILFCLKHPDIVHPKIFYFPLEETPQAITLRFMSHLLSYLTHGATRISPTDLRSTDERKVLPEHILRFMDTKPFTDIMAMYESIVTFYDVSHPTGINKIMKSYAENNGTSYYTKVIIKDELGIEKEVSKFDYYVPNDPKEYVIPIIDHISLLNTEKGLNLKETIDRLSSYMVELRNRYNYSPIIVQQQSLETQSAWAVDKGMIAPTVAGLADSKYTGRDCNVMFGITNPFYFKKANYLGYDIGKLRDNARFIEVVINRGGKANGVCPVFFDGAICNFKELPLPTEEAEMRDVYSYIGYLRGADAQIDNHLIEAYSCLSYSEINNKSLFKDIINKLKSFIKWQ